MVVQVVIHFVIVLASFQTITTLFVIFAWKSFRWGVDSFDFPRRLEAILQ